MTSSGPRVPRAPIGMLIDSARSSLLVEDEEMDNAGVTSALEGAAQRGVNVEVVMTYSSSSALLFASWSTPQREG